MGTKAASGGTDAASSADLSDYQRRLYEVVASHSRYPAEARQRRLSGVTQLAFRLDRLGNVLESWVQKSSGSEVLDNAALAALERAQPLPPIPPALPSRMDFVIEIDSSVMQGGMTRLRPDRLWSEQTGGWHALFRVKGTVHA